MLANIRTIIVSSLLGAFVLWSCDNSTNPGPSNPVIGTWKGTVSDSTMTMVVTNDSTFSTVLPNPAGTYNLTGKYTYAGNTITLSYASALQGTEGIPPPSTPVTGTLSGNKMTIPVPYTSAGDSVTLSKQ